MAPKAPAATAKSVTVYHPETGEPKVVSNLNAHDFVHHLGWHTKKPIVLAGQVSPVVAVIPDPPVLSPVDVPAEVDNGEHVEEPLDLELDDDEEIPDGMMPGTLEAMTKEQLVEMLKTRGGKPDARWNRDRLIAAIKHAVDG